MILDFGKKPLEKRVKEEIEDVSGKGESAAFWHNLSAENWYDLSAMLDEIGDAPGEFDKGAFDSTYDEMKEEDKKMDRHRAEVDEHRATKRRLEALLEDPQRMKHLLNIVRQWKKSQKAE